MIKVFYPRMAQKSWQRDEEGTSMDLDPYRQCTNIHYKQPNFFQLGYLCTSLKYNFKYLANKY